MGKRTPLYQQHVDAGAKLVDFAGWDMPLHYGSQLEEHRRVRDGAGVFDVSHMLAVDVSGPDAEPFLRRLLANDVARLTEGRALYSCMLDERAGVLDDLIVYHRGEAGYRAIVNAGTAEADFEWVRSHSGEARVDLQRRGDLAILAVQGPEARQGVLGLLAPEPRADAAALKPFQACETEGLFIGRTGYTGEDGFELLMPAEAAVDWWQRLLAAGVTPAGLGARDTLRLEAGLNLYGQDMDRRVTPLESGLAWTVAWEPEARDFIGRGALAEQRRQGVPRKLVGLVLEARGVLRPHQRVETDAGPGEITSGSFSPVLGRSIALARVPAAASKDFEVDMRGRRMALRVVKPPFVRQGKALV